MNPAGDDRMRAPSLNPFAFPSDTDFRFALLIAAVLGANTFACSLLYLAIPGSGRAYLSAFTRCVQLAAAGAAPETLAQDAVYQACIRPTELDRAWWLVGGTVVLLLLAAILFAVFPGWKIRRERLERLSDEDAADIKSDLLDLCRELRLDPPIFLSKPLDASVNGLAFGRLGRYYVALAGGLQTKFWTDRPLFRAIVLHELAHLRNGDVDKTYFAIAILLAFALLSALALPAPFLTGGYPPAFIANTLLRLIAMAVIVWLTFLAVLRARETFADLRAAFWSEDSSALRRVFAGPVTAPGRSLPFLRFHPAPATRARLLDDTEGLFALSHGDVLAAGVIAMLAWPPVENLARSFLWGTFASAFAPLVASLIFVVLAMGVTGTILWRAVFAAQARGRTAGGAGRLSLVLGIGILTGQWLSFDLQGLYADTAADVAASWLFNALWACLLWLSLFGLLRWMQSCAALWLDAAASAHSPQRAYAVGLLIGGVWLAGIFSALQLARVLMSFTALIQSSLGLSLVALLGISLTFLLTHPLVTLAFASLWLYPLAAGFWRRPNRSVSQARWAYFKAVPPADRVAMPAPLRPRFGLLVGIGTGIVAILLLLLIRVGARLLLPESLRDEPAFKLTFFYAMVGVAAMLQALSALVVAVQAKRARVIQGLFAASVTSLVATVGLIAINLLFGGSYTLASLWDTLAIIANVGAWLSLCAACAISVLARLASPAPG